MQAISYEPHIEHSARTDSLLNGFMTDFMTKGDFNQIIQHYQRAKADSVSASLVILDIS